jgi:hypothetical protein
LKLPLAAAVFMGEEEVVDWFSLVAVVLRVVVDVPGVVVDVLTIVVDVPETTDVGTIRVVGADERLAIWGPLPQEVRNATPSRLRQRTTDLGVIPAFI